MGKSNALIWPSLLCAAAISAAGAWAFLSSPVDVGWSEEFNELDGWEEALSLVRKPAAKHTFTVRLGYGEFRVGGAGREARWTKSTEPVWVTEYKYLVMRYMATGLDPHGGTVVTLRPGSVGPVTPGASNPENPFAKGANVNAVRADELIQDGEWHLLVKDLSALLATPQIDQMMITVGTSVRGEASLQLDYLRFERADPRRTLSDFLPIKPAARLVCSLPGCSETEFHTVDLHGLTHTSVAEVLPDLGVHAPWLDAKWFTFAGLPFANHGVVATTLEGRETLTLPIGAPAREIVLLLGASLCAGHCSAAWR
jgi:hypothetical protein